MKPPAAARYDEILAILHATGARFIVVGGVSAVLQGAGVNTFDLDLVHARDPENVERLLTGLDQLDAHYRHAVGRVIRPSASHLSSPGHQLLYTRLGNLDLLGTIDGGRAYEDLIAHTDRVRIGGMELAILKLEELVEIKRRTGRTKDKLTLHHLLATLRERERGRD